MNVIDFMTRESTRFVGRVQFIDDVVDYVSADAEVPLVISGSSGAGKTALAAKLDAVLNGVAEVRRRPVGRSTSDSACDDESHPQPPRLFDESALSQSSSSSSSSLAVKNGSLEIEKEENISSSFSPAPSPSSSPSAMPSPPSSLSLPSSTFTRHVSPLPPSPPSPPPPQRCLTLINGLVSSSLNSFDDFLRGLLAFLGFSFDAHVARVCRNLPTLAREALSHDYESSRVILLDGIQFLRGGASVATKLSWLPLKLGKNVSVILTLSTESQCQLYLDELKSREQKPRVMNLPPLQRDEIRAFLQINLSKFGPPLPDVVVDKKDAGNPLWLYFLCLELSNVSPRFHPAKVNEIEETLEDRIGQILLKYPLVNPDEGRCRRVDCDNLEDLVVGALCLLCLDDYGLTEAELCELLSDKDHLLPPSEHVEKGESERSEKSSRLIPKTLTTQIWKKVRDALLPMLQPAAFLHRASSASNDNSEEKLAFVGGGEFLRFHHSIIRAAACKILFDPQKDDVTEDCKPGVHRPTSEFYRHKVWWHTKLAKFFEKNSDANRKAEEYPRHLKALGDVDRLAEYLTDWNNFDLFFCEPTLCPETLLKFWEAAGGNDAMVERYGLNLKVGEDLVRDKTDNATETDAFLTPLVEAVNNNNENNNNNGNNNSSNNQSNNVHNIVTRDNDLRAKNLLNRRRDCQEALRLNEVNTARSNDDENGNDDDGFRNSSDSFRSREEILLRYEKVAELLMIAGSYMTAIEMTWHAIEVEMRSLGARPVRLASLYDLASKGYTEIVKMFDFASEQQLPHIHKAIFYGRKAIRIREDFIAENKDLKILEKVQTTHVDLDGVGENDDNDTSANGARTSSNDSDAATPPCKNVPSLESSAASATDGFDLVYQRHRLGLSRMNLAFNLDSWDACGGNNELSGNDARREGLEEIDKAIEVFAAFKDDAHMAEALMTKGILSPRGSSKQQKLYNRVMELTKLTFGKYHPLTCRLYINIGILYEDNQDFKKAYEYFKEWSDICENVYGKKHPKTVRAYRVLKEPRYQRMADLETGVGGFVDRVLRSATEAFTGGDGDSNRLLEQCHEIAEAEYGDQEEEENQLLADRAQLEEEEDGAGTDSLSDIVSESDDDVFELAEEIDEISSRYDNLLTDNDGDLDDGDDDDDDEDDETEDSDDTQETLSEMEEEPVLPVFPRSEVECSIGRNCFNPVDLPSEGERAADEIRD